MPSFYVLLTLPCYTVYSKIQTRKYAKRQYNFSPEKVNNAKKLCENIRGRPQQENH